MRASTSLLVFVLALIGGDATTQDNSTPYALRSGAENHGIMMGAEVAAEPLKNDRAYAQTLAREYNMLVPGNAMKFRPLRPTRSEFKF
jgi:GH35 family endo-1,4-beta-xylanase